MKLLSLLAEKFRKRRARKYGKGCARVMFFSYLMLEEHSKEGTKNYALLARKALNTRPNWRQESETVFIYERAYKLLVETDRKLLRELGIDQPWQTGILDVSDNMALLDVVQDVIRIELNCYYLSDIDIKQRFELIDLAVSEGTEYIEKKVKKALN